MENRSSEKVICCGKGSVKFTIEYTIILTAMCVSLGRVDSLSRGLFTLLAASVAIMLKVCKKILTPSEAELEQIYTFWDSGHSALIYWWGHLTWTPRCWAVRRQNSGSRLISHISMKSFARNRMGIVGCLQGTDVR